MSDAWGGSFGVAWGISFGQNDPITELPISRGGLPPNRKDYDAYLAKQKLLDEARDARARAKRLDSETLENQIERLVRQTEDAPIPVTIPPVQRSASKRRKLAAKQAQPVDFGPILTQLKAIQAEIAMAEDEEDIAILLGGL